MFAFELDVGVGQLQAPLVCQEQMPELESAVVPFFTS